MRDDNDLDVEINFFKQRGKVKNIRKQKVISTINDGTDLVCKSKKRGRKGNIYQHTKTGARADLGGIIARSSWEADVMRILNAHKIEFLFEPVEFRFPADTRGRMHAYLPDIYLIKEDEYIEVKGYLDARGRSKLRKFKKYYPEHCNKLTVIISKSSKDNKAFFKKLGVKNILYYEHLSQLYKTKITTWEGK